MRGGVIDDSTNFSGLFLGVPQLNSRRGPNCTKFWEDIDQSARRLADLHLFQICCSILKLGRLKSPPGSKIDAKILQIFHTV